MIKQSKIIKQKMLIKNIVFLGILMMVFPVLGQAQEGDLKSNEEVMVIAPFNPTIRKAHRILFLPETDTNKSEKLKINYITGPKIFPSNIPMEEMKAAKFVEKRPPNYSQNFVKLGYGLYATPYAELFFNSKMSKESQVGIYFKHLSTKGEIKEVAYSGNSRSIAEVWTQRIQKKHTTKLNFNFERNLIHYYGFYPEDYPDATAIVKDNFKEDIKQVYSKIGIGIDFKGAYDKRYKNWQAKLKYNYFWDHYESTEHILNIGGHFENPVEIIKADKQYVGISIGTQTIYTEQSYSWLYSTTDSSQGYFHGLYHAIPYYTLTNNNFSLKIGVKMEMAADSNAAEFNIAPLIKVDLGIADNDLRIYTLIDGGFYNNSLTSLSGENHFVSPHIPLKYSKSRYRIRAGIKGHYTSFFDFHLYGEMAGFENMPLFITDTLADYDNSYTVIYDGGSRYSVAAELLFKKGPWNVNLNTQYNAYNMDTATRAWHKPAFSSKLKISYYALENLKLTALLIGQSKMYNLYEGEKQVDAWFDMSFKADYHFKRTLAFFLTVSNILSNNYELWYAYPTQSIGVMGGVSLAF